MNHQNHATSTGRREFLVNRLPACALSCLALSCISSLADTTEAPDANDEHKFEKRLDWTYEEAYFWKFKLYVDRLNRMANYIGREKLISALKKSTEEYYGSIASYKPENTLQEFVRPFFENDHYKTILTINLIDYREDKISWEITECLNAKIFEELHAPEIGYATLCHGDEAWAKAYHPDIRFVRTKTLMEGDACCNHCYTMKKQ